VNYGLAVCKSVEDYMLVAAALFLSVTSCIILALNFGSVYVWHGGQCCSVWNSEQMNFLVNE
jgi:hypothetical protein